MSWLDKLPPKIRSLGGLIKRGGEDAIKCPKTGFLVFIKDLEKNFWVDPDSGYHFQVGAHKRLDITFDNGTWEELSVPEVNANPLGFRDRKRHSVRVREARKLTGMRSAIALGFGAVENVPMVIAAHDFRFVGGSVGTAEGETVMTGFKDAVERRVPLIIFTSSGGARLQEGIYSLMQLPRTTVARDRMREAKLPFIVVLTNPTMGGTTASYGMLGDIHIAEPEAQIGFAGRRVIEQVTKEIPPAGFQDAEKLLEHGMLDIIVDRRQMRSMLARLCRLLGASTTIPHPNT